MRQSQRRCAISPKNLLVIHAKSSTPRAKASVWRQLAVPAPRASSSSCACAPGLMSAGHQASRPAVAQAGVRAGRRTLSSASAGQDDGLLDLGLFDLDLPDVGSPTRTRHSVPSSGNCLFSRTHSHPSSHVPIIPRTYSPWSWCLKCIVCIETIDWGV